MYVCLYRLVSAFRVLGEHVLKPLSGLVLRRAHLSEDIKHVSRNILFSSVRSDLNPESSRTDHICVDLLAQWVAEVHVLGADSQMQVSASKHAFELLVYNLYVATVYFLDSSDRISRGSNTGERENILFTLFVCCHSKIEMIECLLGWRRPCQCPRPALSGFTKDSLKEHPAWRRFRMIIIHKLLSPDGLSYIYRILCGDLV